MSYTRCYLILPNFMQKRSSASADRLPACAYHDSSSVQESQLLCTRTFLIFVSVSSARSHIHVSTQYLSRMQQFENIITLQTHSSNNPSTSPSGTTKLAEHVPNGADPPLSRADSADSPRPVKLPIL